MGPINSCHYRGGRPRLGATHLSCLVLGHPEAGALALGAGSTLFYFLSSPHTLPLNLRVGDK